jgi:XTP/dITP diphosphohydrolase
MKHWIVNPYHEIIKYHMQLCFATNNKHKLQEISHAVNNRFSIIRLADLNCTEELPETRDTLEGNALQKAEYIFQRYQIPVFADDSGLEVEALGGEPGVYSARYAGNHKKDEDNITLLLKNLSDSLNRKARFRTVIALLGLGEPHFFEGSVEGTILHAKRGSLGFGYDPIFQPDDYTTTFAEMDITEKNRMSHRARAVQKLIDFLNHYSS